MSSKTEVKKTAICCSCARCDIFSGSCCCCCCSWSNCSSLRKGLKQLKKKALSALCMCWASPHSAASPKSSSPVKPNPNPKPQPKPPMVVATLDSHRTEAVKACIEYINATSSSSMKLSTSASGSSSSSSTSSGPKPDSVPSK